MPLIDEFESTVNNTMLARTAHRYLIRNFFRVNQCSVRHHNFDGESYSKTNLNLLTKEDDGHTYVEAFSPIGFRLSSGLRILGPCALFPKSVLHWNVASSEKITPDSLSLFSMLEPKPDILIIGIGDRKAAYDKNVIKFLRSKRINVEILPTEQACSTFNFLNSERRVVAAALIPPSGVDISDDRMVISDLDDTRPMMDDNQTAPESQFLSGVTSTMESFKDKGMVGVMAEKDREREKRDLKKMKAKNEDEEKNNSR